LVLKIKIRERFYHKNIGNFHNLPLDMPIIDLSKILGFFMNRIVLSKPSEWRKAQDP